MNFIKEKRRSPREALKVPAIGILYPKENEIFPKMSVAVSADTMLAYIHNRSDGGLLIETPVDLGMDAKFNILVRFSDEKEWRGMEGTVAWMAEHPKNTSNFLMGIQVQKIPLHNMELQPPKGKRLKRMYPSDLEFLLQTNLFTAISSEVKCPLLNSMMPERIKAGAPLITQG